MWELLGRLFSDEGTLPHAVCLDLRPELLWLSTFSDALIAVSYYSIPFALTWFALRRRDLSFRWMFWLFGAFILACGTTHVMHIYTLWYGGFGADVTLKLVTAAISFATAALLWPLLPKALALPSPAQLADLNRALSREVNERQLAEAQVRATNHDLEDRVRQRTLQLEEVNHALRQEIDRRIQVEDRLRRLNQELEKARRAAESANLTKSKFLAAASHDLRQPVQALFYFNAALANRLRGTPHEALVSDMAISLDSMGMLLNALLDVSKLDAGIIKPEPASFPLSDMLARLQNEFAPLAAAKGLGLRMVPCGAVVHSDRMLVGRVLQNLLTNAVRYTETGRILIGCRHVGDMVRVEVWDTGIGIPEDRLQHIFEEFYQVGNEERDRGQGLGLGLAIVDRLVRLLGLRLDVRSKLGRGSMFALELPLAVDVESRCTAAQGAA